jgi:cytoskeletal protein RodZ
MSNKPIGQRFEMREKKRRANTVLNTLIVVVVLLIAVVTWGVFFASGEPEETKEKVQSVGKEQSANKVETETSKPKEETKEEKKEDPAKEAEPVDGKVMVTDIQDKNVVEAYTNPAWKSIGTSQSEPHVTKFDSSSVDWKEMLEAAAYATELTPSDIFAQRISNGGGSNKVNAVVGTKDRKHMYRVKLEWVTNEGWKPILVEQLKS